MILIVCASLSALSLFFPHFEANQHFLSIIFINDFMALHSFFHYSQIIASHFR